MARKATLIDTTTSAKPEAVTIQVEIEGAVYAATMTSFMGGDDKRHFELRIKDQELRGEMMRRDRRNRKSQLLGHYGYESWDELPQSLKEKFEEEFSLLGTFPAELDKDGQLTGKSHPYRPSLPIGNRVVVESSVGDLYVERKGTFAGVVSFTCVDDTKLPAEALTA